MIVKTSYSFNYDSKNNKISLLVWFIFSSFFYVITEHFSPIQVLVSSLYKNILAFHPAVFAFLDILNIEKGFRGKKSAKSTFEKMSEFVVDFLQFFCNRKCRLKKFQLYFVWGGKGGVWGHPPRRRPSLCKRDQSPSREKPGNKTKSKS